MTITVISDTHGRHKEIVFPTLDDDINVLIHCGDFSHNPKQVFSFSKWFSEVPGYDYRIIIAGNHDMYIETVGYQEYFDYCKEKNIIYLQDTSIDIEGVKFHGSPWSNRFGSWAFMDIDIKLDKHWQKIPDDVEILITHGPSKGIGDKVLSGEHVGSSTLTHQINNRLTKLKLHCFGHIHEAVGVYANDRYTSINASTFDWYKDALNKPKQFKIK